MALEIAQRAPAKYLGAQIFAGMMYVAAALSLLPIRAWKIRQMERLEREKRIDAGESGVIVEQTPFLKAMVSFRRV